TPSQIRLSSRVRINISVLVDVDAAGFSASVRGIDLILEEGMNVKVCTFPDGEDPDSFARKTSFEDLTLYLEENAKDFIQFKARSEEHTSELQSRDKLVCRLLLVKKKYNQYF